MFIACGATGAPWAFSNTTIGVGSTNGAAENGIQVGFGMFAGSVVLATKPPFGGTIVGASMVPEAIPSSVRFLLITTCSG